MIKNVIITAGPTYLDIDAYACCAAMAELLNLQGIPAVAYSKAPYNYSVCRSLISEGQITDTLPADCDPDACSYIIVDVSDPHFLGDSVPLDRVSAVYDHHVGSESYWTSRIGDRARIEFIGAAATLIWREWISAGLQDRMSSSTARLLIAAILDNTLNLTSSNTTDEDIAVFRVLCEKEGVDGDWCASYFSEVQESISADLKNALFGDIKTVYGHPILPQKIAQLCIWDAQDMLHRLPDIRSWFDSGETWMLNLIDIRHQCSYFVCDSPDHQASLANIFGIRFDAGIAKTEKPYLRKQILKMCQK